MELKQKQQKIAKLRQQIAACERCTLHQTRTQTVPGEGSADAEVMFIGEAPGKSEDLQGQPFVGRAGKVLDELLASVKLSRDDIYICNILKCRPPNNRNPLGHEIQACVGSLDIQIKVIDPKIICTLGNFATTYIFEKFQLPPAKISAVRGQIFEVESAFGHKRIIPLFHPAVVTYNPTKMDILLKDFLSVKKSLNKTTV